MGGEGERLQEEGARMRLCSFAASGGDNSAIRPRHVNMRNVKGMLRTAKEDRKAKITLRMHNFPKLEYLDLK